MQVPVRLLPFALSELFVQATLTGQIALADRYGLMAALLEESLTEEERASIDRLLRGIRRGQIQMIDELSLMSQSAI